MGNKVKIFFIWNKNYYVKKFLTSKDLIGIISSGITRILNSRGQELLNTDLYF
jgi:hypothetical protein